MYLPTYGSSFVRYLLEGGSLLPRAGFVSLCPATSEVAGSAKTGVCYSVFKDRGLLRRPESTQMLYPVKRNLDPLNLPTPFGPEPAYLARPPGGIASSRPPITFGDGRKSPRTLTGATRTVKPFFQGLSSHGKTYVKSASCINSGPVVSIGSTSTNSSIARPFLDGGFELSYS